MAFEDLDGKASQILDINCNPFYFDGSKAHSTEPFQGTGYSCVFFCVKKVSQIPEDQCQYLKEMGFDLPLKGKVVAEVTRGSEAPDENPKKRLPWLAIWGNSEYNRRYKNTLPISNGIESTTLHTGCTGFTEESYEEPWKFTTCAEC